MRSLCEVYEAPIPDTPWHCAQPGILPQQDRQRGTQDLKQNCSGLLQHCNTIILNISKHIETYYNSEASLASPAQEQLALGQKPPETMNNCCKSGRDTLSLALVSDYDGQEPLNITYPHNP